MNDIHNTIEAFADGEPVDPARLKHALATAEGREYLVDLLVLRGFVGGDVDARPRPAETALSSAVSRGRWLSVAAAVAAVSLIGGYYAGRQSASAPATGASGSTVTARVSAPEPTRVIRLEDSADWTERVGEN